MQNNKKYVISLLGLFLMLSVGAKYYKYIIIHDYMVVQEISCNPEIESCFISICETLLESECVENPYKYIYKNAKHSDFCNPFESECEDLYCSQGETDCEIIECSEDTVGDDELCVTSDS